MNFVTQYHELVESVLTTLNMSDKLAHVHVGMAIYVAVQVVQRNRRGSAQAVLVVLAAELFNEVMDRLYLGRWDWADTLGDIAATMLWPSVLTLVSRYRRSAWQRRYEHRRLLARMTAAPARAIAG